MQERSTHANTCSKMHIGTYTQAHTDICMHKHTLVHTVHAHTHKHSQYTRAHIHTHTLVHMLCMFLSTDLLMDILGI